MGWILVFTGGLIGSLPTMIYQVWNGASLIGVIMSVAGALMVMKGTGDVLS
jgi:hypothetical protein